MSETELRKKQREHLWMLFGLVGGAVVLILIWRQVNEARQEAREALAAATSAGQAREQQARDAAADRQAQLEAARQMILERLLSPSTGKVGELSEATPTMTGGVGENGKRRALVGSVDGQNIVGAMVRRNVTVWLNRNGSPASVEFSGEREGLLKKEEKIWR
jgi:hypothetical protein